MNLLPPLPAWNAMHPLLVHFPIALLVVTPVALLVALFVPRIRREVCIGSFALAALGTLSLVLAAAAGEAAGEAAKHTAAVQQVLEEHEELAETARTLFIVLTVMLGVVVWGPSLRKRRLPQGVETVLVVVMLAFFAGGVVVLANAAHQGGRLVHEFGVRAAMSPGSGAASTTAGAQNATPAGGREADGDAD